MAQRACWTDVDNVEVGISADFHDQYGSTIEEGGIAIVLLQDQDGLVIEGATIEDLRDFVERVEAAIDAYEREHPGEEQ